MTITSEEVALLDDDDVQNIQTHYDLAMESEHGTVCVTRKWAGVDKTPRPRFCSGVEKARKCRRIPLVGCTLC